MRWTDHCEHARDGGVFLGTVETPQQTYDVAVYPSGDRWDACFRFGDHLMEYVSAGEVCAILRDEWLCAHYHYATPLLKQWAAEMNNQRRQA